MILPARRHIYILAVFFILFATANFLYAVSPDAISIRVIPNPSHISALDWYKNQNFSGSPQSLIVDGYNAVRNGRTIYVNAANIVRGKLYTNIYLISFNQQAEKNTEEILTRIIENWKFNTNYPDAGVCVPKNTGVNCLYDSDCIDSDICSSDKSKIIRDTKRLSDLYYINKAVQSYKAKKDKYPPLSGGTYLKGRSVSTWPSWKKTLSEELNFNLPLDPVNKMGSCSGYNEDTCWNAGTKEFYDPSPANSNFDLPSGSHAYVYQSETGGLNYKLCSYMESGFVVGEENGACPAGVGQAGAGGTAINHPPKIRLSNLPDGHSGYEYIGFIEAYDEDGDSFSWKINTNSGNPWSGWSSPVAMIPTASPLSRKLYADKAGDTGNYGLTITLTDERGGSASYNFNIEVIEPIAPIPFTIFNYIASATNPIDKSIIVRGDVHNFPFHYSLLSGTFPPNISDSFFVSFPNYTYAISGLLAPGSLISPPVNTYNFNLQVTDSVSNISSENFVLNIYNSRPIVSASLSNCQWNTRINHQYCGLSIPAVDPENNKIVSYSFSPAASGLAIDSAGNISGTAPSAPAIYNMSVIAEDEYGAVSVPFTFDFHVNTYCSDGNVQTLNGEGVREQCDTAGGSGTGPNDMWLCNSSCQWVGGWCGDMATNTPFEECDSPGGNGTGPTDLWGCTNCEWAGGWCGDTAKDSPEECDTTGGAGTGPMDQWECDSSCKFTGGYVGDGIVQTYEDCDDGNSTNPGCSPTGHVEDHYLCSGSPSVCVPETKQVPCSRKPDHSEWWNDVGTIWQTWDPNLGFIPSNTSTFSISASTGLCHFKCETNYDWDSNSRTCMLSSSIEVCKFDFSNIPCIIQ